MIILFLENIFLTMFWSYSVYSKSLDIAIQFDMTLFYVTISQFIKLFFQVIDQVRGEDNVEKLRKELERREGYWQNELMTFVPWGLNIRDEVNGIDISATSTNDFDGTSDVNTTADGYHFNAQEQVNGSNIDVV